MAVREKVVRWDDGSDMGLAVAELSGLEFMRKLLPGSSRSRPWAHMRH